MHGSNSSAPAVPKAAGPEPVGLAVHSMPVPDAAALRNRTAAGRLKMLLVLAVCAMPVVASYVTYFVLRPQLATTNYGTLIQPTRTLPVSMPLRALDGTPVRAQSLRGQWLLTVVAPGACDAACEQRLFMQRQLREMLGRDRARVDRVWLVTDDAPVRPELQAALAGAPAVQILRAARPDVAGWLEPAPGQALDDHLYLVDPMGEWMMRMPAHPDPSRVKRDLERLLRASSSWDTPGH